MVPKTYTSSAVPPVGRLPTMFGRAELEKSTIWIRPVWHPHFWGHSSSHLVLLHYGVTNMLHLKMVKLVHAGVILVSLSCKKWEKRPKTFVLHVSRKYVEFVGAVQLYMTHVPVGAVTTNKKFLQNRTCVPLLWYDRTMLSSANLLLTTFLNSNPHIWH